ncbi:MAG: hypothetical protein HYX29_04425 [Solirubrobacterales bacterium]|nr:hypothetical protein [Solirubrobacterales bacterium]
MNQPQFIAPTGVQTPQEKIEARTVVVAFFSPLVFAFVYFFWLALDDPPLPILALLICISSFVVGVAAATSILRTQGVPLIVAVLVGIVAVPIMLIAASFVVIAFAFMLGGLIDSIF